MLYPYSITKEKEMYDNSWFIFYMLSVPMFTVGWVTWLLVKRHERKMQEQLEMANKQIEMGKQTVIAIARTVDAKDPRTSDHSKRVAIYSKQIAKAYAQMIQEGLFPDAEVLQLYEEARKAGKGAPAPRIHYWG